MASVPLSSVHVFNINYNILMFQIKDMAKVTVTMETSKRIADLQWVLL